MQQDGLPYKSPPSLLRSQMYQTHRLRRLLGAVRPSPVWLTSSLTYVPPGWLGTTSLWCAMVLAQAGFSARCCRLKWSLLSAPWLREDGGYNGMQSGGDSTRPQIGWLRWGFFGRRRFGGMEDGGFAHT